MQRSDGAAKHTPTRDEYEERLSACERAMLRQSCDYKVASEMMARFGVVRKTATDWCGVVRERWRKGSSSVTTTDHDSTKAEARARLLEVYRLATEGVWLDSDPDDPQSERRMISGPNLKVANDAAMRLSQLDGHLTAKGPPQPPPEKADDPVVLEIRAGFGLVEAGIREAGGINQFLAEAPTMPSEDDMNPRAAVRRKNAELAELRAKLAELEARLASGG